MMRKQMQNLGKAAAEGFLGTMKPDQSSTTEWHSFSCDLKHEFALKVPVPTTRDFIVDTFSKLHCPICDSTTLTKNETF